MNTDQLVNDPHIQSRRMVVEVEQMISGPLRMPGSVFKLSDTPGDPSVPAPFLGEHNGEIYGGLLGFSEAKIEELAGKEVI
jgi:crotonobetainyl-CoA:carnitine CoA-transferase CaiB-like acyl-CoA transferase